jgi:hypothetical protein
LPAEQSTQLYVPAREYLPAEQTEQLVEPEELANVPALQSVQNVIPAVDVYLPEEQYSQAAPAEL